MSDNPTPVVRPEVSSDKPESGTAPAPRQVAPRLSARIRLAVPLGTLAGRMSRALGRGGGRTVAGRVVLRLAPSALEELGARHRVAFVSGTNGKTTTTRYLAAAMRAHEQVVSNDDGANLLSGLVATLMRSARRPTSLAVLEVDEAVLRTAVQLKPEVIVLLNLSRDQLDRTSEIGRIMALWTEALTKSPETVVVANADDPLLVVSVRDARPHDDNVIWVAAGLGWQSDAAVCPRCQSRFTGGRAFRCTNCTFARPTPAWSVNGDQLVGPEIGPFELDLPLPGQANCANAALALAAATHLGADVTAALEQVRTVTHIAGRYLFLHAEGCDVQLLLAKNPASWKEMLAVLGSRETAIVLAVNARGADGKDPSWLWDVPFEVLAGRNIVVTGERAEDLCVRLDYAEVPHTTAPDVVTALRQMGTGRCDIVGNYTAFQEARRLLEPHAR